jgi:hypothetical protein
VKARVSERVVKARVSERVVKARVSERVVKAHVSERVVKARVSERVVKARVSERVVKARVVKACVSIQAGMVVVIFFHDGLMHSSHNDNCRFGGFATAQEVKARKEALMESLKVRAALG